MIYNGVSRNPNFIHATPWGPKPFKAIGRKPVWGGRWTIRKHKWPERRGSWSAHSSGRGHYFSRTFVTWHEAVEHATKVSNTFADPTPDNFERLVRELYPQRSDDGVIGTVKRFARFQKPATKRGTP